MWMFGYVSVSQVREGGGSQSPYIEQLLAVTKEAENAHRGLWSKVGHLFP